MPEKLERTQVNGVSLAYREAGRGDPVVLVHGSASDIRTWDGHVEVFGSTHRVIAYSRRYARPNEDIADGVLGREAFERLSEARRQQVRDNVRADKAQLLGTGFPSLSADDVRNVEIPTLLLHGEQSPRLFRYLLDGLAELLPNNERAQVPAATHIMHEDNPGDFQSAVRGFLQRQ